MEENKRLSARIIKKILDFLKQNKKARFIIIVFVILISLFNIFFGIDNAKKDATFTVESGSSTILIANNLKEEKIISKKTKFILNVMLSGNQGNLKFGTFDIEKGMSHKDIIQLLVNGGAKKETVTLVIPEGFSIENIKKRMIDLGLGTNESIEEALLAEYPYEFTKKIPEKTGQKYKLQGFLFPQTYEFYSDAKPYDVISRMLLEFENQYKTVSSDYDDLYNIITKASMIEREAKIKDEQVVIAGVIENRLKRGMKLQIDATVAYVISDGLYNVERVLYRDLENKSPYNTYYVSGLPIGPISNPGIDAIKAAKKPSSHNYLFYHTDEEKGDGSHIFTVNFNEHKETMN